MRDQFHWTRILSFVTGLVNQEMMQKSLIGASGERLHATLSVIDAISQGRSLWIAACNAITTLPPELWRRFMLGTYFFDHLAQEEHEQIWEIDQAKYGVSGELPDDDGWTRAEIKECCRKAYRGRLSLVEAALRRRADQGAPAMGHRQLERL
jgi:hypothetical protein